jgi:hypothetical protein
MGNHGPDIERAVSAFTADKLDPAAMAQLRSEHLARAQKVGDAVVQGLRDIHDALDAGQRQQVAEFVRAHHSHHGG